MNELDTLIALKHGATDLSESCWETYPEEFLMTFYRSTSRTDFLDDYVFCSPRPAPQSVTEMLRRDIRQYYEGKALEEERERIKTWIRLKYIPIQDTQEYVDSIPEMVKLRLGNIYRATFIYNGNAFTVQFLNAAHAGFGKDFEEKLLRFIFEYECR